MSRSERHSESLDEKIRLRERDLADADRALYNYNSKTPTRILNVPKALMYQRRGLGWHGQDLSWEGMAGGGHIEAMGDASIVLWATEDPQDFAEKMKTDPKAPAKLAAAKRGLYYDWVDHRTGTRFEILWIAEGECVVGSDDGGADERPRRVIYETEFWIQKDNFTQDQWKAIMGAEKPASRTEALDAVTNVSWHEATEACAKIGAELPHELHWEKAVRGPLGQIYQWGDEWEKSPQTPSPFGVVNSTGVVWQWCENEYASETPGPPPGGKLIRVAPIPVQAEVPIRPEDDE